jgi:DegV family protein with EDD domain
MSGVAVVTDTTHYLPAEVVARHELHLVSLYVNWNGRTDRESDLPDYDAFYDHMRSAAALPSTSQPSVGDFLAVYEPLLEAGDAVLSIHLSGGISGTVEAARQARDALLERGIAEERIEVLDSDTGCAGHGLMAIAARNAIRDGADLPGAAAAARRLARARQQGARRHVRLDGPPRAGNATPGSRRPWLSVLTGKMN